MLNRGYCSEYESVNKFIGESLISIVYKELFYRKNVLITF